MRIAPACPLVADIITVHNLFDALTSSSGGQLHFLIYDKYLGSLNKYVSLLLAAEMYILCDVTLHFLLFKWKTLDEK